MPTSQFQYDGDLTSFHLWPLPFDSTIEPRVWADERVSEICESIVCVQVGADMNVMASNAWQAASLQYVAGLAPRKPQSLLQAVQADEYVTDRVSLWKDIWKPGNAVFRCGSLSPRGAGE